MLLTFCPVWFVLSLASARLFRSNYGACRVLSSVRVKEKVCIKEREQSVCGLKLSVLRRIGCVCVHIRVCVCSSDVHTQRACDESSTLWSHPSIWLRMKEPCCFIQQFRSESSAVWLISAARHCGFIHQVCQR